MHKCLISTLGPLIIIIVGGGEMHRMADLFLELFFIVDELLSEVIMNPHKKHTKRAGRGGAFRRAPPYT